jgi:hypothetical protein
VTSQFLVQSLTRSRLNLALLISAILFIASFIVSVPRVCAQEEGEIPLGDVARSFRKKPVSSEAVVDNDNLSKVVDDAASRRAASPSPVFTLDAGGKSFHVSSPDVTCSLSFTAKTTSPLSDPLLLDDLPRPELAKLDGPATIDGDSLQVSMHNGTSWELREVVIGLTIVNRPEAGDTSSNYGQARMVPAVASASQPVQDSFQKRPDVTLLMRVKGVAAPSATAIFRTPLNFALFPEQEWHWAIVKAKGIPPQPPLEMTTIMQSQPDPSLPQTLPAADAQVSPPPPSPSSKIPASADAVTH